MAGKEEDTIEELSMDMLDLSSIPLPEGLEIDDKGHVTETEENTQELNANKVADGENQENVGDSTEEESELSQRSEKSTEESPANNDDNVFKTLAGFLSEQGFLTVHSEEELSKLEDDSSFAALMKKQIKHNEYEDLNDGQIKYLEALREGVPEQVIHNTLKATEAFNQLTDEVISSNQQVRKDLIVAGMKSKGFDEAYALKHYQRVSDSNEDVEEAKMMKLHLKDVQESQLQTEIASKQEEKQRVEQVRNEQLENLKSSVYSKDKVFESLEVSKGLQDRVHSLMTKPVSYTPNGVPMNALMKAREEDPVGFETNLYYIYELTGGFKNLDKFVNKATTKAINSFKSKLEKTNYITTSQNNPILGGVNAPPKIVDID